MYLLRIALLNALIEMSIGYVIGVRKGKDQLLIFLTNLVTNLILNTTYVYLYPLMGKTATMMVYTVGEPLVILSEYFLYRSYMETEVNHFRLSLISNLITVMIGALWK